MNIIGISVQNMTMVSYVLFAASGIFAAAALALFFVWDIRKCWQMVSGKYVVHTKKKTENRIHGADKAVTERLDHYPTVKISAQESSGRDGVTAPFGSKLDSGFETVGQTALPHCPDNEAAGAPGGTICLEMIQDIVYMQEATEIG